jgi:hypothetical protein
VTAQQLQEEQHLRNYSTKHQLKLQTTSIHEAATAGEVVEDNIGKN